MVICICVCVCVCIINKGVSDLIFLKKCTFHEMEALDEFIYLPVGCRLYYMQE